MGRRRRWWWLCYSEFAGERAVIPGKQHVLTLSFPPSHTMQTGGKPSGRSCAGDTASDGAVRACGFAALRIQPALAQHGKYQGT